MATKTLQSKLKFLQADNNNFCEREKSTDACNLSKGQVVYSCTGDEKAGTAGDDNSNTKASAAALISKKLVEENNKPLWMTVTAKKTEWVQ